MAAVAISLLQSVGTVSAVRRFALQAGPAEGAGAAPGIFPKPERWRRFMRIAEMMTPEVQLASPHQSIQDAARMMAACDCGSIPVAENDRLVGMITDRDIAVRAVAAGKDPAKCTVGDVMTRDVKYVFADESESDLARNMSTLQVRRLPVLDREKRLIGIVSLGDLATMDGAGAKAGSALAGVSEKVV
jgi:CBS domain-containing protein